MSTTPLTDAYIEKLERRDNPKPTSAVDVFGNDALKTAVLGVMTRMQVAAASHSIAPVKAKEIAVGALLVYIGDQEIIDAFNAIGS